MRIAALVCAAVGCSFPTPADVVPADDALPLDASMPLEVSAIVPVVEDIAVPLRIATSSSVDLTFTIQGAPSTAITWSVMPGAGTFTPDTGSVATTANGIGVIHVTFTAAATPGDVGHVLRLAELPSTDTAFTTVVRGLTSLGESAAFPNANGQSVTANFLYAQRVHVATPVIVMRLGVIVDTAGPTGRMALYKDAGNLPGALVVAAQPRSLATVTEFELVPTELPAGDYWIAGNFETAAAVRIDLTRTVSQAFQTAAFASPFPNPAVATAVTDNVVNFYLRFTN